MPHHSATLRKRNEVQAIKSSLQYISSTGYRVSNIYTTFVPKLRPKIPGMLLFLARETTYVGLPLSLTHPSIRQCLWVVYTRHTCAKAFELTRLQQTIHSPLFLIFVTIRSLNTRIHQRKTKTLIGSLSTHVFETRTATGSEQFSLLASLKQPHSNC